MLDVDDTLIARDMGRNCRQREQMAVAALAKALVAGLRIALVTGNGQAHIISHLVDPLQALLASDRSTRRTNLLRRLHLYANRGASRLAFDGTRHLVDQAYAENHRIGRGDIPVLQCILEGEGDRYTYEWQRDKSHQAAKFPRFDFTQLPPTVTVRDEATVALRPLPSAYHSAPGMDEDPRKAAGSRIDLMMKEAGMQVNYELELSGRSTIAVFRRGVSKATAIRHLISEHLMPDARSDHGRASEHCIYIGDEFFAGGNDEVVAKSFPRCICISVAPQSERDPQDSCALNSQVMGIGSGPDATVALLDGLAKVATELSE